MLFSKISLRMIKIIAMLAQKSECQMLCGTGDSLTSLDRYHRKVKAIVNYLKLEGLIKPSKNVTST